MGGITRHSVLWPTVDRSADKDADVRCPNVSSLERGWLFLDRQCLAQVLAHEVRAERLADERRALGHIARSRLDLSGGDDDRDVRPPRSGLPGEVEAVLMAPHLHVGEQQLHVLAMLSQDIESLGDIHRLEHLKSRIFEDAGRAHEDWGVVDKGVRHIAHGERGDSRLNGGLIGPSYPRFVRGLPGE